MTQVLCWTLLHSLWQGIVMAVIAGILLHITRRSGAALRYNLMILLFGAFMLATCGTFVWQLYAVCHQSAATSTALTNAMPVLTIVQHSLSGNDTAVVHDVKYYTELFYSYFNKHAALLVTVWFLLFCMKLVRIAAGLAHVQRLKQYKTHSPAAWWTNRMHELCAAMHIRKPVALLESERVKVPVVAGLLKPVILMPLGLLINLPQDELEAILLHELAHVKRRDYLVNLLQSFAETIFFFNPAVLWISSLIREEREHCCDDMAIAQTNDPRKYINALVIFQEYNTAGAYAMGFPGKKNHLLNRVRRILQPGNNTANAAERTFLVACFCIAIVMAWAFTQPDPVQQYKVVQDTDTIPATQHHSVITLATLVPLTSIDDKNSKPEGEMFALKSNDSLYQFRKRENEIEWLRINGQDISSKNIPAYYAQLDLLITGHKQAAANNNITVRKNDSLNKVNVQGTVVLDVNVHGAVAVTDKRQKATSDLRAEHNTVHFIDRELEVVMEDEGEVRLYRYGKEVPPDSIVYYADLAKNVIRQGSRAVNRDRGVVSKAGNEHLPQYPDYQQLQQQYQAAYQDYNSKNTENWQKPERQLSGTNGAKQVAPDKLAVALEPLKGLLGKVDAQKQWAKEDSAYQAMLKTTAMRTGIQTAINAEESTKRAVAENKTADPKQIYQELLKDKLVEQGTANTTSYKLNRDALVVNDIIMPETVHSKYKAMFVKDMKVSYLYRWTKD